MSERDIQGFIERFTVRLPDGMRDAIAERAKANGRSMNSEIVQIIQDALDGTSRPVSGGEALEVLMAKMAAWYQANAPLIDKFSHMDNEQLRKISELIEKEKPT